MKALKDVELEVRVTEMRGWYWYIEDSEKVGIEDLCQDNDCKTKQGAKNNWKRFAKLNGITNYKFI